MKLSILTIVALMGLGAFVPSVSAQVAEPELERLDDDRSKGDLRDGIAVRGPITTIRPAALFLAGLDSNSDYQITRAEFDTGVATAFGSADRDGSNSLSLFELEDWRLKALGSMDAMPGNFSFDENHDNRITRDEFYAALAFEFTRNDKDEDGVLSFSDIVRVMELPNQRPRSDRGNSDRRDRLQRQDRF